MAIEAALCLRRGVLNSYGDTSVLTYLSDEIVYGRSKDENRVVQLRDVSKSLLGVEIEDDVVLTLLTQVFPAESTIAVSEVSVLKHVGGIFSAGRTYCVHESPSQGLDSRFARCGRILEVSASGVFQVLFVQLFRYDQLVLEAIAGDQYKIPASMPPAVELVLHLPMQIFTIGTLAPARDAYVLTLDS